MTATILRFPKRTTHAERLALMGNLLTQAVTMPDRDMELDMLLAIGGKLLDNLNDYTRPDCSGLLDNWLTQLDSWEGRTG